MSKIDELQLKNSRNGYLMFQDESEFLTRARTLMIENKFHVLPVTQKKSPTQRHEHVMTAYFNQLLSNED